MKSELLGQETRRQTRAANRKHLKCTVIAVKIISLSAVLAALGGRSLPAAAQSASGDFRTLDRVAQINAGLGFADSGTRIDVAQDGMLTPKTDNPSFAVNSLITHIPLQRDDSPKTTPIRSLNAEAQNEPVIAERTGPQSFVSRLNQGLHLPLLKQATIANILVDLKKRYGPESMTQPGNFHWFIDTQRQLAIGNKTPSLVACGKMARWSNICASANASTFSVYFKVF
jgi:hypothetical protein